MRTTYLKIITMLIVMLAALTACSVSKTDGVTMPASALSENYNDALPARSQLIVGTLLLEGTDQQVTPEQARDLLPLWQGSSTLQRTGTGAQEEILAVLAQIEDVLTAEQLQAIEQMQLTRTSMQDTAQSFGLAVGAGGGTGLGASGQRGQGTGQPLRSGPNTSEMLLDQLLTVLQGRLK
jgi:hypothetical protein